MAFLFQVILMPASNAEAKKITLLANRLIRFYFLTNSLGRIAMPYIRQCIIINTAYNILSFVA